MPYIPPLTDSYIDETYARLVQVSGSSFADGLGNVITLGPPGSVNPTPTYIPYNNAGVFADSYLNQSGDVIKTYYNGDVGLSLNFGSNVYTFGDYNGLLGDRSGIQAYTNTLTALGSDTINVYTNYGGVNIRGGVVYIGDLANEGNKTKIALDDITQIIKTTNQGNEIGLKLNFATNQFTIGDPSGTSGDYGYIEVTPIGFTTYTSEASLYSTTIQIGRGDLASQIGIYGNDVAVTGSSFTWNDRTVASIADAGSARHIPFYSTDNILSTSSLYQSGSSTVIINQNAATEGAPEALYVWQPIDTDNGYNVISGKGTLNNYLQLNIHNTNPGIKASSDVVATANNGNENGNYIDMGINSSGFNGDLGKANDAYLYSTGSDLHIGNASPNKLVQFFAGGLDTDTNRKFQLNANNQHNMTGSLDISGSLKVRNLITASVSNVLTYNPTTGQVYYTASSAIGGGGSGTPVAILDEGSTLTSAVTSINFTGAGVAATNVGNAVTVTINGTSIDTSAFATTGSNTFRGNQIVTGSLFTSGSNTLIGSTTLTGSFNVSGSTTQTGNNTLIGNTVLSGSIGISGSSTIQGTTTMTGSLSITGSTTQVGNNTLIGNTLLSGSIIISGSSSPGSPTASVQIYGDIRQTGYHRFDPVTTNINTSTSASYIYVSGSTNDLYFTQNGSGYSNTSRLRWLEGGALYTGLLYGGVISSTPGTTTFKISSGSGLLVTMNASTASEPFPTVQYISWPDYNAQPIINSGSAKITYVGIDNNGQIIQQVVPWGTNDINQWDNSLSLGVVLHLSGSVSTGVFNAPQISYGGQQKTDDFFRAFGPLKISGHTLQASGSTLSLTKLAGTSYREGANYVINANHPSTVVENSINTSKIYRYYLSGSTPVIDTGVANAGYTVIDPTKRVDTATGLLTGVSNNKYSLQRVFWVPNSPTNAFIVYYGNAQYDSLIDAVNAKDSEPFSEAPNTSQNAIFLGYIAVAGGAADLTNASDATIVQGGLFRSVGGVGSGGGTNFVSTTLAGLSDVTLTSPSNNQLLAYNSSTSKWNNVSNITASVLGNLTGTASTASYVNGNIFTNNNTATSASYAVTSSYITGSIFTNANSAASASYAVTASYATTSSYSTTSSYAQTASYVTTAQTASYVTSSNIVGTVLSSSYAATASLLLGTVENATNAVNASSGSDFVITSTLKIDKTLVDYGEQIGTGTGTYTLFDFATGSYTSAHGKYTLSKGTNARAGEFITVWNGTTANYTDVSTTDIGSTSDISLQAIIVADRIQINAVTLSSGWTVKMLATFI